MMGYFNKNLNFIKKIVRATLPVLFILCFSLLYGCSEPASIEEALKSGRYYNGIKIGNINVSGLTYKEAEKRLLDTVSKKINAIKINIQYESKNWQFDQDELGMTNSLVKALTEAMYYGRTGSEEEKKAAQQKAKKEGVNFPVTFEPDQQALADAIASVAQTIDIDPIEPTCIVDGAKSGLDRFSFTKSEDGLAVDQSRLMQDILAAYSAGTFPAKIDIPTGKVSPKVTTEGLRKNTVRVAVYTTTYLKTSSENRIANIQLALEKLNGATIAVEAGFSFNDFIGPRTEELGWKMAATIINGNAYEDNLGGGICQVSTTLYNAVIRAGLKINTRRKHSIPSNYVPYGLDAAVSYGATDFAFTNNTDFPVYIFTSLNKNTREVSVSVYGRPLEDGVTISIRSEIVEVLPFEPAIVEVDPSFPPDKVEVVINERNGYKVDVYKETFKKGVLIESKRIYTDIYRPVQGQLKVGSGYVQPSSTVLPDPSPLPPKPSSTPHP